MPSRGAKFLLLAAVVLSAAVGLACAGPGQSGIYYATGKDAVTPDGLHRVSWEPFSLSFVKPGADLGRYDQVLIDAVTVSYKRKPTRNASLANDPNFALTGSGTEFLKKKFHDIFSKELAKSANFGIATAPGPNVLSVQGHLVDLVMTTPPVREQNVDAVIAASSFGAVTLMLDARDSLTGEPLVRVGERSDVTTNEVQESGPAVKSLAWEELCAQWATKLRRELDQFHALPSVPIPAVE